MKKIYAQISLLIIAGLFSANTIAATFTITVANFSFTPNTITVNVGDTVMWMLASGTHTTTSVSVPPGADSWNSGLDQSSPMFEYVIVEPGEYDYVCTIHASMTGTIIAVDNTGINAPATASAFSAYQVRPSIININYDLNQNSTVKLSVYDMTGKVAKSLLTSAHSAGTYSEIYSLEELRKGIYMVELLAGDQRIVKRIVID